MTHSTPYAIPETPPSELMAELDTAARALDRLAERGARLSLGVEGPGSVRIELADSGQTHRLTAAQLLDLLAA